MTFQLGNKVGHKNKGKSKFNGMFRVGDKYGLWTIVNTTLINDHNKKLLSRCRCGKEQYVYAARLLAGASTGCRRCKTAGKNHYKWSGYGELPGSILYQIKENAKHRKLDFTVTPKYLWNLFQKQEQKCALSGLPLYWVVSCTKSHGRDFTASLDRIDSSKGYVVGNVQWVHKDINTLKTDFSQTRFIELCKMVAKHYE